MSTAYRKRQKLIRAEKKRRGPNGLIHGQIPPMDFKRLMTEFHVRKISTESYAKE